MSRSSSRLLRFIGGYNRTSLLKTLNELTRENYIPIIDYAREGAKNASDVMLYKDEMNKLIEILKLGNNTHFAHVGFACKLSSYAPYGPKLHIANLVKQIHDLPHQQKSIFFDAEHTRDLSRENAIFDNIIEEAQPLYPSVKIFKTYQMYRRDALQLIEKDLTRFDTFGLKIVRGAYHSTSDDLLFQEKSETDANYDNAIHVLHEYLLRYPDKNIHVCFATHNKASIALANQLYNSAKVSQNKISYAQLLDMGDASSRQLVRDGHTVFKYVPYGNLWEVMPYLIRRLYENAGILRHAI